MKLRVATPDDEPRITSLLARSYPALMAPAYDSKVLAVALPLMTRANESLLASGTYFVVEAGGDIAGCGGWTKDRPGGGGFDGYTGHIRHFATDPDRLRHGIGKMLLLHCLAIARAENLSHMDCFSSLNAVAFYQASGFEQLGSLDVQLGGTVPFRSIHMRRRL